MLTRLAGRPANRQLTTVQGGVGRVYAACDWRCRLGREQVRKVPAFWASRNCPPGESPNSVSTGGPTRTVVVRPESLNHSAVAIIIRSSSKFSVVAAL